jgi:hypothetical protein
LYVIRAVVKLAGGVVVDNTSISFGIIGILRVNHPQLIACVTWPLESNLISPLNPIGRRSFLEVDEVWDKSKVVAYILYRIDREIATDWLRK